MKHYLNSFRRIALAILLMLIFGYCSNDKSKNNTSANRSDTIKVKSNSDSAIVKQDTNNKAVKLSTKCNINIAATYTDYSADPGSGDMFGTAFIKFKKLADGNYEATFEQRFGSEGGTYPLQKTKNLFIDDKGNITFEVKWFTDPFGDKAKSKIVKVKGIISASVLKFKTDIPNSDEIVLNKG